MATPKTAPAKGLLKRLAPDPEASGPLHFARFHPSPALEPFVEHHWTVAWNVGDRAQTQQTLPYPSVQLVFEAGHSRLFGVMTGKFSRTLRGRGRVVGVKFHPGGFRPLLGRDVAGLTDRRLRPDEVLALDTEAIEHALFPTHIQEPDPTHDAAVVAVLEDVITPLLPPPDGTVAELRGLVRMISEDRSLLRVSTVAERAGTSVRRLQRLFHRYVGVSPKWVIRRCRLHDAAGALDEEGSSQAGYAELAAELGYADQAHFIRDFRDLVGVTPAAYATRQKPSKHD